MELSYKQLQELYVHCMQALKKYIDEVNRTCQLLDRIQGKIPISLEVCQKLLQQRDAEDAAYNDYLSARQELFGSAGWEIGDESSRDRLSSRINSADASLLTGIKNKIWTRLGRR